MQFRNVLSLRKNLSANINSQAERPYDPLTSLRVWLFNTYAATLDIEFHKNSFYGSRVVTRVQIHGRIKRNDVNMPKTGNYRRSVHSLVLYVLQNDNFCKSVGPLPRKIWSPYKKRC
jgi:hypothetical protein